MTRIKIIEFCTYHSINEEIVLEWAEEGICTIEREEDEKYLPATQINDVERAIRLHRDLEINTPGIAALLEMRRKMRGLREEIIYLESRLRKLNNFYTSEMRDEEISP